MLEGEIQTTVADRDLSQLCQSVLPWNIASLYILSDCISYILLYKMTWASVFWNIGAVTGSYALLGLEAVLVGNILSDWQDLKRNWMTPTEFCSTHTISIRWILALAGMSAVPLAAYSAWASAVVQLCTCGWMVRALRTEAPWFDITDVFYGERTKVIRRRCWVLLSVAAAIMLGLGVDIVWSFVDWMRSVPYHSLNPAAYLIPNAWRRAFFAGRRWW